MNAVILDNYSDAEGYFSHRAFLEVGCN